MSDVQKGGPTGKLDANGRMMEVRLFSIGDKGERIDMGTRWVPVTEEQRQSIIGANNPVVSMGAVVMSKDLTDRVYDNKPHSVTKVSAAADSPVPDWREIAAVKPGKPLPPGVTLQAHTLPATTHTSADEDAAWLSAAEDARSDGFAGFEVAQAMLPATEEEDEEWEVRARAQVQAGIDGNPAVITGTTTISEFTSKADDSGIDTEALNSLLRQAELHRRNPLLVPRPPMRAYEKALGIDMDTLYADLLADTAQRGAAQSMAASTYPAYTLTADGRSVVPKQPVDLSGNLTGIVTGYGLKADDCAVTYEPTEEQRREIAHAYALQLLDEFDAQARVAEHSGHNVNYYSVPVRNPKRPERLPHIVEVEDLIQALNLGFHEATVLKSMIRSATERELGLTKKGGDAVRDAEKMVHSSQEHLRALKIKKAKESK